MKIFLKYNSQSNESNFFVYQNVIDSDFDDKDESE